MARGHILEFEHRDLGKLQVRTGADRIAWGYSLNVAVFPTYAGEVVQVLSCYVENLEITGTLRTYRELEQIYTFFLNYTQIATQGDQAEKKATPGRTAYNQEPMIFRYPHRGWEIEIMPTAIPGFRKGRDVVAPEWRLQAHIVDDEGDVDNIKDLVVREVEIKKSIGSNDPNFDENFGLQGKIKFVDENPFSDPLTDKNERFERNDFLEQLGDYYTKILPSYIKGDFDAIFGGIGSKPAFTDKPANRADSGTDKDADLKSNPDLVALNRGSLGGG